MLDYFGAGHWQVVQCTRPQSRRGGLRHVPQSPLTTMGQLSIDPYTTDRHYLRIDMFLSAEEQGTRNEERGTGQNGASDSSGDEHPTQPGMASR
jgi:hypothetical protein